MRVTYDPAADAACLYLVEREAETPEDVRTEEAGTGVMLDFDRDGRVMGVEILGPASSRGRSPCRWHSRF